MEENNFLLTYRDSEHIYGTFIWFNTEEELNKFIEENDIDVIEAIQILSSKNLIEED